MGNSKDEVILYMKLQADLRKQIKKMCEERKYICHDDIPFVDEWIMDIEKLLGW